MQAAATIERKQVEMKARRGPGRPFVKGQSGNPFGRKPPRDLLAALRQVAESNAVEYAQALHALATKSNKPSVQLAAIEQIYDRLIGKAVQSIHVTQTLEETTARRLLDLAGRLNISAPIIDAEVGAVADLRAQSGTIALPQSVGSEQKANIAPSHPVSDSSTSNVQ